MSEEIVETVEKGIILTPKKKFLTRKNFSCGTYRARTNNSNGRKKRDEKGVAWHLEKAAKARGK